MTQFDSGPVGTEPAGQAVGMDAALKIEGDELPLSQRGAGRREEPPDLSKMPSRRPPCRPNSGWPAGGWFSSC